jgi:cobalt/nickel transport system ATP-binding protein
MTPRVHLHAVEVNYGSRPVLRGATLVLHANEKIGLAGAMGAGNTTLLHLVVGLLRPERGVVKVFGIERRRESDFHAVRRRVGLVFQDADDQLFCPTVLEDVAFGPLNLGLSPRAARRAAHEALERVGLPGFEDRVTYRLSGGEKRLVALATVLAMQPDVLLLDEPGNGLDADATARVRALLVSLPQSMILVSHDTAFLDAVATRRLTLRDGRIV